MKIICVELLLLLFITFSSCNSDSKKAGRILQSAENIVEQFPDSALRLLDSIQNPYELNPGLQAKYSLLLVESKYKTGKDIPNDSLIFKAKKYFKKSNDLKRLALSVFYSGRVLESLQKPQEALTAFLDAESIAMAAKEPSLAGFIQYNIGNTYYQKGLFDEAIVKFKQSAENFAKQSNDYKKEIMVLDFIGTNYAMKNNMDSALFYFNDALSKVINFNDSTEITNILLNMGATFLTLGKNDEAIIKLIEAEKYSKDSIQQAKINLNLANVYVSENKLDSAAIYIARSMELAQKTEDKTLQAGIWYFLSQIDEKRGNYKVSLEDYKKYADLLSSIYEEEQKVNYLDIQKKYDFELLKNANEKLVIERLWIVIFSILVISVICFIFYRNRSKNREALLIAEQQICQLKEMVNKKSKTVNRFSANSNEEINNKLRNTLFQQLDIFKKIPLMEAHLQKEDKKDGEKILEKINLILYNSTNTFDWKIFYQSVNALYSNYLNQLKKLFPKLSEEDILICCLSKSGFNNKEISLLKGSNQNIVQKKKSAIRKKIGMKDHGNFITLLDEIIKKSINSIKIDNHLQ